MLKLLKLLLMLGGLCAIGCTLDRLHPGSGPRDAGLDAQVDAAGDAGSGDSAPAFDASPFDVGVEDAAPLMDAVIFDTRPADMGPPDVGPPDVGPPDMGPPDMGPPDMGPPDIGPRPSCDELYSGSVRLYHLCQQTDTACEFYTAPGVLDERSCDHVCAQGGGVCLDAWRESGLCGHSEDRNCDFPMNDMICLCSR